MHEEGGDQPVGSGVFPWYFTALIVVGMGLVVGGFALWWPQRGGSSTADSDLGLSLIGGGLAITVGFIVARVVFLAERRLDAALRADQAAVESRSQADRESRERETRKQTLSMATILTGADLHGADLGSAFLRGKDLSQANLSDAILDAADLTNANLRGTLLRGAQLRGTLLRSADLTEASLERADVTDADMTGALLVGALIQNANAARHSSRDSVLRRSA